MIQYTPAVKQKIRAGLIRYFFEKGQSWTRVHYEMRFILGMDDSDKRLHERDPRNFCVDGIEATAPKLALFVEFLRIVYGESIDLRDVEDHTAQIGLILAGFSIGHEASADKRYAKAALDLASQLFVSKTYHDNDSEFLGMWVQLTLCTAQKKNPFLRIVQASVRVFATDIKEMDALTLIDRELGSGTESSRIQTRSRIIDIQRGVLCPVMVTEGIRLYSGICSTPNHVPSFLFLRHETKNGAIIMNHLTDPLNPSEVKAYRTTDLPFPHIRHFLTTLPDNLS